MRSIRLLPTHRQKAGRAKGLVETREQRLDGVGLLQRLAERPDRVGVRNAVGKRQAEKTHEREAVLDQIFGPLVGKRVHRLKNQDLEHDDGAERRTASLRAVGPRNRRFQ
jgi:hypothetical protein